MASPCGISETLEPFAAITSSSNLVLCALCFAPAPPAPVSTEAAMRERSSAIAWVLYSISASIASRVSSASRTCSASSAARKSSAATFASSRSRSAINAARFVRRSCRSLASASIGPASEPDAPASVCPGGWASRRAEMRAICCWRERIDARVSPSFLPFLSSSPARRFSASSRSATRRSRSFTSRSSASMFVLSWRNLSTSASSQRRFDSSSARCSLAAPPADFPRDHPRDRSSERAPSSSSTFF
mmetsp:Transcript_62773/g.149511  ORF Transcript_62773/g.149511 Transcript_62773/m.149511 type:complete len:246 (-) Transcript_62773:724-1461(-)